RKCPALVPAGRANGYARRRLILRSIDVFRPPARFLEAESQPFRPLPLLGNPHVQTLLSACLPDWLGRLPARERTVALADGDAIVLHGTQPEGWRDGDPLTLLVHGLGGTHASGHVRRTAWMLQTHGVRVVRIDLRGCGRGAALARRGYHAGSSADVRAAV